MARMENDCMNLLGNLSCLVALLDALDNTNSNYTRLDNGVI